MIPFSEHTAFRIGCRCRDFLFHSFPTVGIPVKQLFPMCLPVFIDLLHGLFLIDFGRRRDHFFHFLIVVGVCFDMGTVHKHNFRGKIIAPVRFKKYSCKNLLYGIFAEAVPEVITDDGEMGNHFIEQILQKSTVCDVHINLFHGTL